MDLEENAKRKSFIANILLVCDNFVQIKDRNLKIHLYKIPELGAKFEVRGHKWPPGHIWTPLV